MDTALPPPSRRSARLRIAAMWLLGLGLAGAAADLVVGNFDEVLGAADLIGHPRLGWLGLAIAAELASYVAYAGAQKLLLRSFGFDGGLGRLTLLNIAGQALGLCLPAGYAVTNVFSYRLFRRWKVSELVAGRVLLASSGLYVSALALLALAGAQFAGDNGPVGEVRTLAYVLLGVVVVVALLLVLRRHQARRALIRVLGQLDRRFPALRGGGAPLQERLEHQARSAPPLALTAAAGAGGWLLLAWLGDLGCLAAAFGAVHASVPWSALLLAYCAGQISALLPITPGGLGVVEGSLTFALVAYGGTEVKTVAAVLLYRLISFWGLLPAGAGCYLALRGPASPLEETA